MTRKMPAKTLAICAESPLKRMRMASCRHTRHTGSAAAGDNLLQQPSACELGMHLGEHTCP